MDADRIAELRRLCAEATPGPWINNMTDIGGYIMPEDGNGGVSSDVGMSNLADAAFIAAARTALPELLDEVGRLWHRLLRFYARVSNQRKEIKKLHGRLDYETKQHAMVEGVHLKQMQDAIERSNSYSVEIERLRHRNEVYVQRIARLNDALRKIATVNDNYGCDGCDSPTIAQRALEESK